MAALSAAVAKDDDGDDHGELIKVRLKRDWQAAYDYGEQTERASLKETRESRDQEDAYGAERKYEFEETRTLIFV